MIDMRQFTRTRHDDELQPMIQAVAVRSPEHIALAGWAILCLERMLPVFAEKYPDETVLQTAVETLRRWMRGELGMMAARAYTFTVLALARELEKDDVPYAQIVRAAAHCLAACHVPTHAEGTAMYVVSAIKMIYADEADVLVRMTEERRWQIARLKEALRSP